MYSLKLTDMKDVLDILKQLGKSQLVYRNVIFWKRIWHDDEKAVRITAGISDTSDHGFLIDCTHCCGAKIPDSDDKIREIGATLRSFCDGAKLFVRPGILGI